MKFVDVNTGFVTALTGSTSVTMFSKTTDGGLNWSHEFPGLKANTTSLSAVNNDTIFITGFSGTILRRTSETIGIGTTTTQVPDKFMLSQNYPNPFNPSTNIRFDIPAGTRRVVFVQVVIYDILGREIETIVNEQLQPGTYEVEWDASNFSSGIYYYKLIAGSFTATRKMVLVK
jgi:hypothetical protein